MEACEFCGDIKLKSQVKVQNEINLHKLRKKVVHANWSKNNAKINYHDNSTYKTHHILDLGGITIFSFYNILCDW
jgi:hypothetical protein